MDSVTLEQIERFQMRHRVRAPIVLSALGQNHDFMAAIESDVGQELLKDLIIMMEEKAQKIANETANDLDRADYRAFKRLSIQWMERINNYNRNIHDIKTGALTGGRNGKRT